MGSLLSFEEAVGRATLALISLVGKERKVLGRLTGEKPIIETENVLPVGNNIKIVASETSQEPSRSRSAGQHVIVKLNDQQWESVDPFAVFLEKILFSSLDIDFTNEWKEPPIDLSID